jgi:hypothetical protein
MKLKTFYGQKIQKDIYQIRCEDIKICILKKSRTTNINGKNNRFWFVKYNLNNLKSERYNNIKEAKQGIIDSVKCFINTFLEEEELN